MTVVAADPADAKTLLFMRSNYLPFCQSFLKLFTQLDNQNAVVAD